MLKIAWSPIYHHPLPEGHRFPMAKYSLLVEQLLYEGTVTNQNFFDPEPASRASVLSIHSEAYWQKLMNGEITKKEARKIGFPYDLKLVERELKICGGSIANADFALTNGCSMNIAGGTHHAYADHGEGFCLLNDIAIAASHLLKTEKSRQILVVDLDVHQGNGTAKLFENNPQVFTFSMHGGANYPLHKEQSDLDVPLPDGIKGTEYLELLKEHLYKLFDRVQLDFIFFQSGVDVLETDKLGRMGLTIADCKQRDQIVFNMCKAHDIPVAVSMGGGYSERLRDIIEAHANTFRLAQEIFF